MDRSHICLATVCVREGDRCTQWVWDGSRGFRGADCSGERVRHRRWHGCRIGRWASGRRGVRVTEVARPRYRPRSGASPGDRAHACTLRGDLAADLDHGLHLQPGYFDVAWSRRPTPRAGRNDAAYRRCDRRLGTGVTDPLSLLTTVEADIRTVHEVASRQMGVRNRVRRVMTVGHASVGRRQGEAALRRLARLIPPGSPGDHSNAYSRFAAEPPASAMRVADSGSTPCT